MPIVVNGTTIPTTKGKILFNGTQVEEVIFNGTTVWQATSSETTHTHTDSCYTTPNYGWGQCGGCGYAANGYKDGSTICPNCGLYSILPAKVLSCSYT